MSELPSNVLYPLVEGELVQQLTISTGVKTWHFFTRVEMVNCYI